MGVEDYVQRISTYAKVEVKEIAEEKAAGAAE